MRRAIAIGIVGVALVLGAPGTARADVPISQVGWWTRSPSPPTVPEGGIAVGAAPDGALTVGAVLLDAGDGATGATLRLVQTGGQGAQLAGIQVCPTTADWAAGEGEAMDKAPKDECASASVAMALGEDGTTWTADVQKLVDGKTGSVGLIVVPAPGSVAFQLAFAPPSVAGSVSEGSSEDVSSSDQSFATTPVTEASSSPSFDVAPPPATTPATTATTVPAVQPIATPTEQPQLAAGLPARSSSDPERGVTKLTVLAWYVIAAAVGAAVSGLTWLRANGRLEPAAVLATVRRRR
jgi:hypothetical protein